MSDSTTQFIRLRPDSLQSHYKLAVVLDGMVRLEAAEYDYRRAWSIEPESRDVEEPMQDLERARYAIGKERVF